MTKEEELTLEEINLIREFIDITYGIKTPLKVIRQLDSKLLRMKEIFINNMPDDKRRKD